MQGPQGEAVPNVGGGEELGDNPGAGGGWKQEIRWCFSVNLSFTLSGSLEIMSSMAGFSQAFCSTRSTE